eukprot:SM000260S09955  [mRNA]  locus=s260:141764:142806:+ [translate_table: standard]
MRLSSLRGRRFAQFLQSGGDASGVVGAAFAAWGNGDHGRLGLGAPPRSGALPVALGGAALAGCGGARQNLTRCFQVLLLHRLYWQLLIWAAAGCGADSGAVFAAGLNDRGQLGLAAAVERSLVRTPDALTLVHLLPLLPCSLWLSLPPTPSAAYILLPPRSGNRLLAPPSHLRPASLAPTTAAAAACRSPGVSPACPCLPAASPLATTSAPASQV